jgi:hypothetical protein
MAVTANYSFAKRKIGHPVRDDDVGDNLDLIDTAIKARQTENETLEEVMTFAMSFETDEQTVTKLYFPYKVTINKIRSIVMKALGATDTGTITGANATGASTNGVVTIAISAALNEEDSAIPTTNNVVAADSYYKLTTAKSTAGGKVLVSLEYTRTV